MTGEAKNKLYIKTVQFINVQKKNATARIGYFFMVDNFTGCIMCTMSGLLNIWVLRLVKRRVGKYNIRIYMCDA